MLDAVRHFTVKLQELTCGRGAERRLRLLPEEARPTRRRSGVRGAEGEPGGRSGRAESAHGSGRLGGRCPEASGGPGSAAKEPACRGLRGRGSETNGLCLQGGERVSKNRRGKFRMLLSG